MENKQGNRFRIYDSTFYAETQKEFTSLHLGQVIVQNNVLHTE